MSTTEETLAVMRREIRHLLETAMEGVLTRVRDELEQVEQQRAKGLAELAEERAKRFRNWPRNVPRGSP
jgi:C4-type Zn-finger protein